MNHEPNAGERTRQLIAAFIDGELSATDAAELNQLLKSDSKHAEQVVDQLLLDSLLSEELGSESLTALVDLVGNDPETTATTPSAMSTTSVLRFPRGTRRLWQSLGGAAIVAAIVVAFVMGRWENSALANAATIVRAAMETHTEPVERVYIVQTEPSTNGDVGFKSPRDVRVVTQGDRFYVAMNRGEHRWFWGRDANGATWMTLGPRRALRIDPDETGPALAYISDLYSLNLESVLDNALRHCEIETTSDTGPVYEVKAIPKRSNGWLRELTIEVDKETKAVRKLVLLRRTAHQGDATITFRLVDASTPDESKYRAEGHLVEPFQIFSRDHQSEKRRDVLKSWFGMAADRWITLEGKKSHEK
jgi:hypothetical protein